jgi:hypothetical protein
VLPSGVFHKPALRYSDSFLRLRKVPRWQVAKPGQQYFRICRQRPNEKNRSEQLLRANRMKCRQGRERVISLDPVPRSGFGLETAAWMFDNLLLLIAAAKGW